MRRWILIVVLLSITALACSIGGEPGAASTPTTGPEATDPSGGGSLPGEETETPVETEALTPTATASPTPTETSTPEASAQQICESLPRAAVSAFLYGLEIGTVVGERDPDGIYCRFETIDVEGTAGDLGRSRAVATLKLWDSFDACLAAGSGQGEEVDDPPSPWTYLRVVSIPDKPELILTITAFDGEGCLTVAAADVSSRELDVWLDFLEALAAGR